MNQNDYRAFEEEHDALEQDFDAGKLFLNMAVPALGQPLYIDPDAPTDNWEGIIKGDADD